MTQQRRSLRRRAAAADDTEGTYGRALRLLARRPLSEAELRAGLAARGAGESRIAATIQRLRRARYVDDYGLAVDYLLTRSTRKRHGPLRLLRELERRGVPAATARRAWETVLREHGIDPTDLLQREVQRRVERAGEAVDLRLLHRIYNAMIRAGHEAHQVRSVLEPHFARVGCSAPDEETQT